MRLQGKVGIVTAAASGMGRAGSLLFAREGASVAVVDVNAAGANEVASQIASADGKAIALGGDLADEKFSRDIVKQTVAKFGQLDFLWAHAGIPGPSKVEGLDLKEFDLTINLNVRTALATTIEAIPELRKRGGGSVLYTSSSSGLRGSPVAAVYSVAKFGVVGMMRSLAKKYGKEQIRFNCVCPGMVDTPMLPVFVKRPDEAGPALSAEEMKKQIAQRAAPISLGRTAQPEDIAKAALFLLSDESAFITGVALPVDGGLMA